MFTDTMSEGRKKERKGRKTFSINCTAVRPQTEANRSLALNKQPTRGRGGRLRELPRTACLHVCKTGTEKLS